MSTDANFQLPTPYRIYRSFTFESWLRYQTFTLTLILAPFQFYHWPLSFSDQLSLSLIIVISFGPVIIAARPLLLSAHPPSITQS